MMKQHGIAVGMTADEFESGHWQRAILEADRQVQAEQDNRRQSMERQQQQQRVAQVCDKTPVETEMATSRRRLRRSSSATSLSEFRTKSNKIARISSAEEEEDEDEADMGRWSWRNMASQDARGELSVTTVKNAAWIRKRVPNNGGEVCARLVEELMAGLEDEDEF